jgi:hypothetical protein
LYDEDNTLGSGNHSVFESSNNSSTSGGNIAGNDEENITLDNDAPSNISWIIQHAAIKA